MGRPTEIKISGIPLFSSGAAPATARPERELFESPPSPAHAANGVAVDGAHEADAAAPTEVDPETESELTWDGDPVVVVPEPLAAPDRSRQPAPQEPDRSPSATRPKPSPPSASTGAATSQVYLIEYRGEFIGTYQPRRRTTARTAYKSVAEQLWQRDGDTFDAERLELYKATPIPVDRDRWSDDLAGGQFSWFAGSEPAER